MQQGPDVEVYPEFFTCVNSQRHFSPGHCVQNGRGRSCDSYFVSQQHVIGCHVNQLDVDDSRDEPQSGMWFMKSILLRNKPFLIYSSCSFITKLGPVFTFHSNISS